MERGSAEGVVCADSDGQHSPTDILAVGREIQDREATMVLGSRKFTGNLPLRSRFGNRLTSKVYDMANGIEIEDPQTGLRGYPGHMLRWLCQVPDERFEYEMNLLLEAPGQGYGITELPIDTSYLNDNKSSHFRPIADSLKVYLPILRFCASSLISGILDFALLFILQYVTSNLLVSVIGARIGSSAANFAMNGRFVFSRPSKAAVFPSLYRYFSLAAAVLACNYGILYVLHMMHEVPLLPAKLVTECTLFLFTYWCQRKFVY